MLVQRHRPMHLVNREGRTRRLVRSEGWPRDLRHEGRCRDLRHQGWSRDLRHEGRCRDIGPGTSSIVKVGPGAWSDLNVCPETLDVKVGPETNLGHEGRCRDIGTGTSSIVKVGPWAWSDVNWLVQRPET